MYRRQLSDVVVQYIQSPERSCVYCSFCSVAVVAHVVNSSRRMVIYSLSVYWQGYCGDRLPLALLSHGDQNRHAAAVSLSVGA
jgi:hypothetical protein